MPATKSASLPYTGGSGTIIYTIIGMGIIIGSIIGVMTYKNKNNC